MEMRSMGLYPDHFQNVNRTKFCTPENKSLYSISLHDQRTTTTSLLNGEHVKKKKKDIIAPFNLVMAKSMGPSSYKEWKIYFIKMAANLELPPRCF